jgi:hypothetical protein
LQKQNYNQFSFILIISVILISSCSRVDIKRIEGFDIRNTSGTEVTEPTEETNNSTIVSSDTESSEGEPDKLSEPSMETDKNDVKIINEESIELNKRAQELFENEQYEEALDLYRESIEKDGSNYEALYNYAKALAILKGINFSGYYDADFQVIDILKSLLSIRPEYIDIIKAEEAFKALEKNYFYLELLGYDIYKTEDALYLLQNLGWYIRGGGLLYIYGALEFKNDGTFELWYYTPDAIRTYAIEINDSYIYAGVYSVNQNEIELLLSDKMLRKRSKYGDIMENTSEYEQELIIKGIIQDDGNIKFEIFDYVFAWQYPARGG